MTAKPCNNTHHNDFTQFETIVNKRAVVQPLSQFELSKVALKNLNKFDLSPTAKLVLLALIDCYNPRKEEIYPKQKTIADDLGISDRSVTRAIKEITDAGLLIYERKYQNRYKMTPVFFGLLSLKVDPSNNPTLSKNKKLSPVSCQSVGLENDSLSPACIEQKEEQKKNKILSFGLTEFQKKYADVFEKLSENEIERYKTLQGYEKESWLKAKKKDFFQVQSSKALQEKLKNDKKNTGSPLDFNKEQAIEYLRDLPEFLKNSYFAKELRKKWKL